MRKSLCTLLMLFGLLPGLGQAYTLEVDADQSVRKLLEQFLDLARYRERSDLNEDQFNFMVATTPAQVKELLATEGYFSPETQVDVQRKEKEAAVIVRVKTGPRTVIDSADIKVEGPANEIAPRQVAAVRRGWPLKPGEAFRQEEWSEGKERGLRILQNRRFASAEISSSRAAIRANDAKADLEVVYDSGPAYSFGPLTITGTRRYPESIIRNVNPLRQGEMYEADRLQELQRAILATSYFSNATVELLRDPAQAANAPVKVQVTEFPEQSVRSSVGYTTDTGFRLQERYNHYNVFNRAFIFEGQLNIEQRRQLGSLSLSMPPDSAAYVNNVHASLERTTLSGVDLQSRRIGLKRWRSTPAYDLAWSIEHYNDQLSLLDNAVVPSDIVTQPGTHRATVLGASWTRRQLDSLVYPRDGHVLSLDAGVALKGLLTDQTFFRSLVQGRKYIPVGRRDTVLLRTQLGAVVTKGGNAAIPASLLFRAGGTDSIRGYTFQSIGNEANGVVYPTRYLATGSAEYQHWFNRSWGGATFYDVGTATDNWPEREFFHAVGVGVRWRSPAGVINADLAYGFQRHQIRPHISLGIAF